MHRSTLGSLVLLAIVIISDVLARKDYEGPTVNTRFGPVRGRLMLSARRNLLSAFLGIPYAQPPIGELRFQSPQPWNGTWTEPRDATVDGFQCAQILKSRIIVGNEDCLFLNIFVPHKMLGYDDRLEGGSRKMPVIVFVHGGAFTNGNSFSWVYAPDYLLDQEVVLVTINYRVGVLGFFSTGDQNAPGNYGLKDIWMALVWINENIVNFGGDPNLVTLMGQEAGAAAVHLLSLSSKTEGLFQRIITQSGSALAPWAFHSKENIRNVSLELARLCNCYIERQNPETTMNCLRDTNLTCIVNMSTFYTVWDDNPWFVFGPTEELESDEAIITRHPLLQIQRGLFRDIPWIIGITADEGLVKTINIITNQTMKAELLNDPEYILPYLLEYEQVVSNVSQFVQTLMEFYFEHNPLDYNDILFRQHNITEMVNDAMMRWPLYQTLRMQADQMTSDVFYYLFSFEGTFSVSFAHGVERYGIANSDDLNYIFPVFNNIFRDLDLENMVEDWTMIHVMTEFWTSFARDGIPRANLLSDWEPYQRNHRFMRIGFGNSPEISMEPDLLHERMIFWKQLMANVSLPIPIRPDEPNEEFRPIISAADLIQGIPPVVLAFLTIIPICLREPKWHPTNVLHSLRA